MKKEIKPRKGGSRTIPADEPKTKTPKKED